MADEHPADGPVGEYRNEVMLRGRMSAPAQTRQLPSGDTVVTFRVVVERPASDARQRVDTIDCAAWASRPQRSALSWQPGDVVEVTGALRRRFRRGEAGATSRVEVEVARGRRVR